MKKNKKLLIIVSCLLLVGGISFAYFLASTIFSGEGSNVGGTTATINDAELRVEGTLEFQDLDIYPGHENVSSIKVTATGDNTLIPYNLVWNGTNTLNTSLNYTVYKTSSEVEVNATCEKMKGVASGAMMYYEECSISNLEQLGTAISTGMINTNDTKVILAEDEFITASPTGEEAYYYIILEYPNLDESQNNDIGGLFNGEVTVEESDAEPDINIIAAYIKQDDGTYKEVSDIPQSGYTINTEKSVCSNGATPTGTVPNITVNNLSKSGTSCYLYLDEYAPSAKEVILASKTIAIRDSFSSTLTLDTTGTIYQAEDDDGITYYYAGAPTDNWLYFGGFYWRIIRINGDGTIRLIYNGTSTATTGKSTQLSNTSAFNTSYSDNMYVGFKYTSGSIHGTGTDSAILIALNTWYQNNLTEVVDQIDTNAGFCNDRYPSTSTTTSNGSGGTGATVTYYGAYIRLITNKAPTFKCQNDSDLYTTSGSDQGNGSLTYPIGLITADEVVYAGSGYGNSFANSSYYLYTNSGYWTISPARHNNDSWVFYVYSNGQLTGTSVNNARGVRPVINLKADVQLTGIGTTDAPYRVEGV